MPYPNPVSCFLEFSADLANAALTISFQDALFHRKQCAAGFSPGVTTSLSRKCDDQVLRKAIDIFFVAQIPPYVSDDTVARRRGVSTFAIPVEQTNECTYERMPGGS